MTTLVCVRRSQREVIAFYSARVAQEVAAKMAAAGFVVEVRHGA